MILLLELSLILVFAFFLALLASFFSVVIFRTIREESFITGRSKCDHCHKQIAWHDNIPLFSFLWLKGKCRSCHKKIPRIYFLSELLAFLFGLNFALIYLNSNIFQSVSGGELVLYFLISFILLFVLIADLRYMIVPDFFVFLLSFLVVLLQIFFRENWFLPFLSVIFSTLFFLTLAFLARKILKKDALGLGDIKLMIPLSFLLSWPKTLLSIFLAFIIGGIFAMLILITGRKKIGQALPFAPFLVLAAVVSFTFGEAIWHWYLNFLF